MRVPAAISPRGRRAMKSFEKRLRLVQKLRRTIAEDRKMSKVISRNAISNQRAGCIKRPAQTL